MQPVGPATWNWPAPSWRNESRPALGPVIGSARKRGLLCAWALSCAGLPGNAMALHLSTRASGLGPEQVGAAEALYADVTARLPPRWRDALGEVVVEWRSDMRGEVVGRSRGTRQHGRLVLDLRLLDPSASLAGQPADALARRTLVHELAHLYDRSAQGGLSRDPRLLDLAGWQRRPWRWAGRGTNAMRDRSPDLYELTRPAEFVAVNLEDFVLDPQYACRRPQLAGYFAARFGLPDPALACRSGLPLLDAGEGGRLSVMQLDPERVAGIDYLFAEGNDTPMSHWGHAMLRLVICAPGRPRGPDCRLDLAWHRVISFRAFVDDVQVSSWRGLTGRYPSRLYVLPLDRVVDDYTRTELRGLRSLPLRLDHGEITGLLLRAAQLQWSYDGRYFFLSNNCAVETWKLLHDGVPRLAALPLGGITPTGLLRRLTRTGVADASVLDDPRQARKLGYVFDAASAHYQAMFDVVRGTLAVPQHTVVQWLDLPPERRARWIGQADIKASAALLLLEEAAQRRAELQARSALKRRWLSGSRKELPPALRALFDEEGLAGRPAELAGGGYGLPQADEVTRIEAALDVRNATFGDAAEASWRRQLEALLPEAERARLHGIDANLDAIGQRLRHLHEAAGGPPLVMSADQPAKATTWPSP